METKNRAPHKTPTTHMKIKRKGQATLGDTILAVITAIVIIFFLGLLVLVIVEPYFESRHYNKVTGAHTTYWDAVWLELRVQDKPREQGSGAPTSKRPVDTQEKENP